MFGAIPIQTDASGYGVLNVTLGAETRAVATTGVSSVVSILDPQFHIDPSTLSANPTASLDVLDGVGNLTSPVPELPTGAMFLGLPVVVWFARRRGRTA